MKNEIITVEDATKAVLAALEEQNYSKTTIKIYKHHYNGLVKHMKSNNISFYSEPVGLAYLEERYGIAVDGFFGTYDKKVSALMRSLQVLWDYTEYGTVVFRMRPKYRPITMPTQFEAEYQAFLDECQCRQYTFQGQQAIINPIRKFLTFMGDAKVPSSKEINAALLTKFINSYAGCRTRYIATIVSSLRNYLNFLYEHNYTADDCSKFLPKVRIMRNAFIPATWKASDVQKLLDSIDRGNPGGKRDYAIYLTVARLGLRVSDIRGLRLSNLNFQQKSITLTMQKTKKPIELPMLDDIGWALIDYLKNGRPKTDCDNVFIRHRAPYDAFGKSDSLQRSLHRYMQRAGITIPKDEHCGLHSLRSTLARLMLEGGAGLSAIAEVLGHEDIQTTSRYIKIDIQGLRKCVIDPEEVFQ